MVQEKQRSETYTSLRSKDTASEIKCRTVISYSRILTASRYCPPLATPITCGTMVIPGPACSGRGSSQRTMWRRYWSRHVGWPSASRWSTWARSAVGMKMLHFTSRSLTRSVEWRRPLGGSARALERPRRPLGEHSVLQIVRRSLREMTRIRGFVRNRLAFDRRRHGPGRGARAAHIRPRSGARCTS